MTILGRIVFDRVGRIIGQFVGTSQFLADLMKVRVPVEGFRKRTFALKLPGTVALGPDL
jgi:hypothetical protein